MNDSVLKQMVQFQAAYYETNEDIPSVSLISGVQAVAQGEFTFTFTAKVLVLDNKKDAGARAGATCGDTLDITFKDKAGFLARLVQKLLTHRGFNASASARSRAYAAIIRAYEYQARKSALDYQGALGVYDKLARTRLPVASVESDATGRMNDFIAAARPVVITVKKPPTKQDGSFIATITVNNGSACMFEFKDASELIRRLMEVSLDALGDDAKAHAFVAGIETFELYARHSDTESDRVRDTTDPLLADDRGRAIGAAAVVDRSRVNRDAAKERRSSGCTLL